MADLALLLDQDLVEMKALAASIVRIPASLSSLTSRSCNVPNARSERPLACGE